jgi:hypothetical protein
VNALLELLECGEGEGGSLWETLVKEMFGSEALIN